MADLTCAYPYSRSSSPNKGSSHHIWRMPWPGDPRINLQDAGGKAKPYQVRQVLQAIDRLLEEKQP